MRRLNRLQTMVFQCGALLVLLGAVLWPVSGLWAIYIYCAGALGFYSMQCLERYDGDNVVIKRLRRQQLTGGFLIVATGVLMLVQRMHLGYLQRNEWIVALTIGALLELYTVFRISYELKKESSKNI